MILPVSGIVLVLSGVLGFIIQYNNIQEIQAENAQSN